MQAGAQPAATAAASHWQDQQDPQPYAQTHHHQLVLPLLPLLPLAASLLLLLLLFLLLECHPVCPLGWVPLCLQAWGKTPDCCSRWGCRCCSC
jgi:hypothetical protein